MTARARAALTRRGWPSANVSGGHLGYIFSIDAVVLIWSAILFARWRPTIASVWVLVMLIVLAILFEEGASRAARLQLRLSADLKRDMTSVWAVAGAVALPPASATILLAAVLVFVWIRQQRPAGQPLHRKWFNASTILLGALVAGVVVRATSAWSDRLPWALAGAVSVALVILVYTSVNRLLVTIALVWVGVRGRALLGSRDDNLTELATLCLGGFVAIAAVHEPWLCLLVLAPMITLQRGALVRELETAATTDAKTGLLNAIAWEQLAKRELNRAERENKPVGVLIVDIDRFKLVNDRFGHMTGDVVLRGIGRRLQTEVREYDTVGRFGGEEFVVVLPEANDSEALVIAERLRSRVNEMRVSQMVDGLEDFNDSPLSVSIGVACSPTDGADLADLLVSADSALYQAKAGGRNRVVLAERGAGGRAPRLVRD